MASATEPSAAPPAPAAERPAASLDMYELVATIGKGSFGTVSKIRRKTDGRVSAHLPPAAAVCAPLLLPACLPGLPPPPPLPSPPLPPPPLRAPAHPYPRPSAPFADNGVERAQLREDVGEGKVDDRI